MNTLTVFTQQAAACKDDDPSISITQWRYKRYYATEIVLVFQYSATVQTWS